jgi:hypothetical protein
MHETNRPQLSQHFAADIHTIMVVAGKEAALAETKAIEILVKRILSRSRVDAVVVQENPPDDVSGIDSQDIIFVVGTPGRHALLGSLMGQVGLKLPTLPDTDLRHPEGFAVRTVLIDGLPHVLVAGVDERGVIYGVGALLRAMTLGPSAIDLPHLDLVEKPAFPYRGTVALSVSPNKLLRELGNLRPQTNEDVTTGIEDLMLLGANVFRGWVFGGKEGRKGKQAAPEAIGDMEEFVGSHGMLKYHTTSINNLREGFRKEWVATPSSSLHIKVNEYFHDRFVCPSIPDARRALLDEYDRLFREYGRFDLFAIKSGDVGGCTCEKCTPWGGTFIRLVHEISGILAKHHPEAKLLATSQNLTNEGNQAILDYLNEDDTGWLYALNYAPGGNEMSTYNRAPLNPRWFEYEGFGWSNYLKYLHHHLPRKTNVILQSDVTHWIRSQYGVDHPDVALAVIYNRRAWNARPRSYHRVAREVFHYALGDLFYSEGMHDDFNKWFWFRMLWDPNLSAEEITREYCRYWFGPEAEEEMTQAVFLMEETLENRVLGNPGIGKAVDLLRSAGEKMPTNLMEKDYRWRIMTQRALLDRYIQLWLQRGEELKAKASALLEEALGSDGPREYLEHALVVLGEPQETEGMATVREEARRLGEESNDIFGYREPAYFNMKEFDITEIGWWTATLQEALGTDSDEDMRNALLMITRYEDPGEGGCYERVGWPWERTNLIEHQNIIGYFPFTGPARHHHYGTGYSWWRKDARMTFRYDGLDPEANYVVRVAVGFHCVFLKDFLKTDLVQSLEVNGVVVGCDIPLPLGDVVLAEFEIPRGVIKDGEAEIVLRSGSEEFPLAGLCGIWLMRKDSMPWALNLA